MEIYRYDAASKIAQLIGSAKHILVIQAENPDSDSLGSALALEQILSEANKQVSLYCAAEMPSYLHYLDGWDRVQKEIPKDFDVSIIVDASTMTLFAKLAKSQYFGWIKSKPCIVLDHHIIVENKIEFAHASVVDDGVSSTGELIFHLSRQLDWPLDTVSGAAIMSAILGDTQGLSNSLTGANTYLVMAELTKLGVDRSVLEESRRAHSKMPKMIYDYKGELIKRTELYVDDKVAIVVIPQFEINAYSPLYNPAALIQFDMLQIETVEISIVIKSYDNGRITGAIRSNIQAPVAARLAEAMGGGGHEYASGFKIESGKSTDDVKSTCIKLCSEYISSTTGDYETL